MLVKRCSLIVQTCSTDAKEVMLRIRIHNTGVNCNWFLDELRGVFNIKFECLCTGYWMKRLLTKEKICVSVLGREVILRVSAAKLIVKIRVLQLAEYRQFVLPPPIFTKNQGCGFGSAWIRIHFSSWIRIRIRIQEGKFVN